MADSAGRPDLVVSIDFGMTCTGVAYCNVATGSDTVRHIQRWPGRTQANENKVPTLLVYPQGSSTPTSWGFLAETAQEVSGAGHESREWFKIMLDEKILEQFRKNASDPSTVPQIHEVEKFYTDYFQYLYRTIEARLKGELASRWEDARIEFIFSVPTTWKPIPTVERFRKVISLAGFGSHANHTATIGLTEAEAAAVHTARSMPGIFQENELLFVCDVGGGTTDLSVFRVKNTFGGSLNLEQIDVVFGATIGAARLDSLYEDAVLQRLEHADQMMPMGLPDISQAAWAMRISKEYQNAKCDYGSEESMADTDTFAVEIPKLNRAYVNPHYGISGGNMVFRRDELKGFFDEQISKLFDMLDKQLLRIQQKFPSEQVAHLVLSGGLGNSAYVQNRLRSHYASGASSHANARSMQIRVAPDPQLVNYVVDCIDWFIKQGEPVSSDHPVVRTFNRKCPPATSTVPNPSRIFPTEVICTEVDKSQLPIVMNSSCRQICSISSDFSSVPLSTFKLKNRHWWNSGPKYHRINYVVKVNLGPADVSFELWHNGVKLSKDNSIKVEWQAAAAPEVEEVGVCDVPVSGAGMGRGRGGSGGGARMSVGGLVGRKSVGMGMGMNGNGYGYGGNGWDNKAGIQEHVVPVPQNRSTVW
ncbi:hypothetical protein FB567DRAFT_494604 [Paraphoma chrysanthemicola]|uniref:Uncharacterized protein n=1 Tax=Paraphoma chrysanthemicola TaxID=798071 RepID=A0A8K0RA95_9PLEO|nr:hypothetical protein FB567DRAFT_494604 [Paraphoma chrysanthemicola]